MNTKAERLELLEDLCDEIRRDHSGISLDCLEPDEFEDMEDEELVRWAMYDRLVGFRPDIDAIDIDATLRVSWSTRDFWNRCQEQISRLEAA